MKRLELTQVIGAPIEVVWGRIADHEGMVEWSALKRVVLKPEGSPDRNGLGAMRHMMGAGPTVVEEVIEWSPPNEYVYVLRGGAPIRDHRGCVQLSRQGDGTLVRWSIQFRPIVPGTGWAIRIVLNAVIGGMLHTLRRQIEQDR